MILLYFSLNTDLVFTKMAHFAKTADFVRFGYCFPTAILSIIQRMQSETTHRLFGSLETNTNIG